MTFFESKIEIVLPSCSRLLQSAQTISIVLYLTFLVGMAISTRAWLEVGHRGHELGHRTSRSLLCKVRYHKDMLFGDSTPFAAPVQFIGPIIVAHCREVLETQVDLPIGIAPRP